MIARKAFLTTIVVFINAFLGLVALSFVGKYMGATTAGMISFAISFIGLFNIFSDLGFGTAHVKRVSEGLDLGKCIGLYAIIRACLTAICCTAIVSFILISKYIFHYTFYDATTETIVYIFLGHYIISSLSNIMILTFSARVETAKQQLASIVEFAIRTPATIVIALTYGKSVAGASWLSVAYVAGVFGVAVVAAIFFRGYPVKKPDKQLFKSYFAYAMPVLSITILSVVVAYIDKVLLGVFWTAAEVGAYAYPQLILTYTNALVVSGIMTILFPTISMLHAKKKTVEIQTTVSGAERYLSMLLAPITIYMVVFAPAILNLFFGYTFLIGATAFQLLAICLYAGALRAPYSQALYGVGEIKLCAKINAVLVPLAVGLQLLFVPKKLAGIQLFGLSLAGAATGLLISVIVGNVIVNFYSWRILRVKPGGSIVYHLFAAVVMGICLALLNQHFTFWRWYELLLVGLLGIGIYSGLLYALKELKKTDLEFFYKTINLKAVWKYILAECRLKKKN